MSDEEKIKTIAIYLPQFHPIPENNEWWGKGFTEWTNVTKAMPRFEGHYQPHLPSDLGFYDLRLEETRMEQEKMAKDHGVHGFCYYHYWFNGKRILNEPLDRKLKNPKEDLPFMLCWANENWTRAWDGSENQILLKQDYYEEDDRAHARHLMKYFKDERYIKVNGKPFFVFYKPDLFPDMKRTIEIFREEARKEGIELYLCWFERWIGWQGENHETSGFDAAIEFQPLSKSLRSFINIAKQKKASEKDAALLGRLKHFNRRLFDKLGFKRSVKQSSKKVTSKPLDQIIDYNDFIEFDIKYPKPSYNCYPCVCPNWDNSSRRTNQNATIFINSTPQLFKKWFKEKCKRFVPFGKEENFIFINAWNEWAEGNHLEPCQKWGKEYLNSLK